MRSTIASRWLLTSGHNRHNFTTCFPMQEFLLIHLFVAAACLLHPVQLRRGKEHFQRGFGGTPILNINIDSISLQPVIPTNQLFQSVYWLHGKTRWIHCLDLPWHWKINRPVSWKDIFVWQLSFGPKRSRHSVASRPWPWCGLRTMKVTFFINTNC